MQKGKRFQILSTADAATSGGDAGDDGGGDDGDDGGGETRGGDVTATATTVARRAVAAGRRRAAAMRVAAVWRHRCAGNGGAPRAPRHTAGAMLIYEREDLNYRGPSLCRPRLGTFLLRCRAESG